MRSSKSMDFPVVTVLPQAPRREMFKKGVSAVFVIDSLLEEACAARASDIHLDPGDTSFIARLRVDGRLYDAHHLSPQLHHEILARLKILAGLRTDEHQAPQDGRFRFALSSENTIDIRISIAPTYYGENAVLRLLSSNMLSSLASLGCEPHHEDALRQAIHRPHGMILITGPTGSGKTSTLYTLLQLLNNRSTSIITIEDPIEYALQGINQIPANRHVGVSFAEGLRSILRQDPNVIGVGEIRDTETAALATNAALTGHLVLSTLHTTDAPTAIPRLLDMGIEPYLVSSTLSVVVNQRLLRRLCTFCRIRKPLRADQKALLEVMPRIFKIPEEHFESAGCKKCNGTGAQGRIGIFEIMVMTTALREAALKRNPAGELYALAVSQGMLPLFEDGLMKASAGIVSLDEVLGMGTA